MHDTEDLEAVVPVDRVTGADGVVSSVVLAFAGDPFVRWMLPEPELFLRAFVQLTALHGARTSGAGGAWACTDGRGAAFWYPPGVHPDSAALGAVFAEAGVLERVGPVWRAAASYEPHQPHWYLRQIGVDPALQGLGRGGRLLEASLRHIDGRGELAYLEATSLAGRRLYERHGFVTLGEVSIDGSPPLWPMRRDPR